MDTSGRIVRHETPPQTDEEWREALQLYGTDRESLRIRPGFNRTESGDLLERPFNPRPIIHHDDINETFESPTEITFPRPTAYKGPKSFLSNATSESHIVRSGSPVGSASSTVSGDNRPTMALGILDTLKAPVQANTTCGGDGPDWSAEDERWRMREHYEKHGWLPGPLPSEPKRLRKKRAILRLGFFSPSDEDDKERKSVMAKYAEMAQDVFQCKSAVVSMLACPAQFTFGSHPHDPVIQTSLEEAVCGHALIHPNVETTVVADLTKDWRFAKNPAVQKIGAKFYAAAPLRCSWKDTEIDIATLCLYDDKPRDTFDARERAMLVNLANMLVYQLTSLEGQAAAKRSRSMYEQSFNFLRRSVLPDNMKRPGDREKKEERAARNARKLAAAATAPAKLDETKFRPKSPLPRPRRISVVSNNGPVLATKSGPRDSRHAKSAAAQSEAALFKDSAATLRGILKADHVSIVDLTEYTLFIRRLNDAGKKDKKSREAIITGFLAGKPWPAEYEPVIHHTPKPGQSGVNVLGSDAGSDEHICNWDQPDTVRTVRDFAESWIRTRHFWWDREDQEDELSVRLMQLMPDTAQTTLATAFITYDGRLKFAMFASWKAPPSAFADASVASLPFTWVLGGCTAAALAIRKVRALEQSQISYSNLQAHELRTPLHQILAVTQLLRSAMNDLADAPHQSLPGSLTTMEQVRDLLPLLDAIDTSGKTLHGIVDNILSFLDLKGKDNMVSPTTPSLINSPTGATQTLETMFEELIHEASEEDVRSRQANSQPLSHVETVFEILSPSLGHQITEDTGGALRRALSKILANAYKFIEGDGCVEIYLNDIEEECPNGCEELALSKKVSIEIKDNGRGMDLSFVRDKLGEPWAKEDQYATGSGLSVHLAYRIIDLMGGTMEISSAPGQGCSVRMEVALPVRQLSTPSSPVPEMMQNKRASIASFSGMDLMHDANGKKVALVGFDDPGNHLGGHNKLSAALARQFAILGAQVVPASEAELIVANGHMEESAIRGRALASSTPASSFVFYVADGHEPHPEVVDLLGNRSVRRFQKPVTPSLIREALFPGQTKLQNTMAKTSRPPLARSEASSNSLGDKEVVQPGKTIPESKLKAHFEPGASFQQPPIDAKGTTNCPIVAKLCSFWKPKNLPVEDAVACLSLGDYINSHRRNTLVRTPSLGSSNAPSSTGSLPETPRPGSEADPDEVEMYDASPDEVDLAHEPETVKVLVVEDNRINRKILVKLLSSKAPIEVVEAEDGLEAVTLFKEFAGPSIVLLDINMPKMDGFQASLEMRSIENKLNRKKSQIIAVTALGGEAEKHKGLVECGMDTWMTKPCGKVAIHKAIDEAKEALGIVAPVKVDPIPAMAGLGIKA